MKKYICKKCLNYGAKEPCTIICEDDLTPTHCPHDDSSYPNSDWQPVPTDPVDPGEEGDGECTHEFEPCHAVKCEHCGLMVED